MASMMVSQLKVFWPREDVIAACRTYGALVNPIDDVIPAQLLAAMAMNESSLGDNCGPRHEPAYDVGGMYSHNPEQASLLAQFGQLAACSYGPLQIMLVNAPGCTPMELNTNLSLAMRASIRFLNQQITSKNPRSLQDVGQIWNGGHIGADSPGVQLYVKQLQENYEQSAIWIANG